MVKLNDWFMGARGALFFFAISIACSNAYAVDWLPVPKLPNMSYDADTIRADSDFAVVWIKDSRGVLTHVYIHCDTRMIGTIVDNTSQMNDVDIQPGSDAELLMGLCKSKWQFWK